MDSYCCGQAASDHFTCRERGQSGMRERGVGRGEEKKRKMNDKFSAELLEVNNMTEVYVVIKACHTVLPWLCSF